MNREALLHWPFDELEQSYSATDAILYALGLGIGADPTDPNQLRFVYEEGLAALPTMAVIFGYPGLYLREPAADVNWQQMLHGEQSLVLHRPLQPAGRIVSVNRVDDVIDKGAGRGALVYATREQRDAGTGELIATLTSTAFCRADGGFGGPSGPVKQPHPVPTAEPSLSLSTSTLPQAALIYRLSGDFNPIHADPRIAAEGGFSRPVLHGLCTFGIAGYALLGALCRYEPERLRRLEARFSAPVYPGDTITTSIWQEADGRAAYRCSVAARGVVVIDNGYVEFDE